MMLSKMRILSRRAFSISKILAASNEQKQQTNEFSDTIREVVKMHEKLGETAITLSANSTRTTLTFAAILMGAFFAVVGGFHELMMGQMELGNKIDGVKADVADVKAKVENLENKKWRLF